MPTNYSNADQSVYPTAAYMNDEQLDAAIMYHCQYGQDLTRLDTLLAERKRREAAE